MIQIKANGFTLLCDGDENNLTVKEYEGLDSILDLSGNPEITAIDRKVFLSCKNLRQVILPETITYIGDWAFSKCANLKSVAINKNFDTNPFGRAVFEGCDNLEEIKFLNFSEDQAILLATNANKLANDHLLRGADLTEETWYNKWDIYLISTLSANDKEDNQNNVVCGEEDISYDGIGSIDGEMPGESWEYVNEIVKNKCNLCFLRLIHDTYMSPQTRELICTYIKDRAFGKSSPYAWITLKEDFATNVSYFEKYLEIVDPEKEEIERMIQSLGAKQVQAKAYLIGRTQSQSQTDSFFDDLLL